MIEDNEDAMLLKFAEAHEELNRLTQRLQAEGLIKNTQDFAHFFGGYVLSTLRASGYSPVEMAAVLSESMRGVLYAERMAEETHTLDKIINPHKYEGEG